jgi:hypothetical protein
MSDPVPGQTASAIFLSVSTSIATFTALLPSLSEVRKADHNDPDAVADVRMGELAASALVVGIGVIATGVAGSPAPVAASILCALALVAVYESVLSVKPNQVRKM